MHSSSFLSEWSIMTKYRLELLNLCICVELFPASLGRVECRIGSGWRELENKGICGTL